MLQFWSCAEGPPSCKTRLFLTLLFQLLFLMAAALGGMLSGNLPHAKSETVIETSLRKFHLPLHAHKHPSTKESKQTPVLSQNLCANSYPAMLRLLRAWLPLPPETVPLWMAFKHWWAVPEACSSTASIIVQKLRHQLMSICQNLRLLRCCELHSPSSSSSWYHSTWFRAAELHNNFFHPLPWMGMAALSWFTSLQIQLLCLGTLFRSESIPLLAVWQTHKHQIHVSKWKKREKSKWDILYPELPLLFCKVEAKANVSNSRKGNDSKNNPDDLLILLHSCTQPNTNGGQSRVHQTYDPMHGIQIAWTLVARGLLLYLHSVDEV